MRRHRLPPCAIKVIHTLSFFLPATVTATAARRNGCSGEQTADASRRAKTAVWIAIVLPQQTPIILLDELTTYLDIVHQMDVLDLLHELNKAGRTIVAVLHDFNHAARYASHIIAEVLGLATEVIPDPLTGSPQVVPHETRLPP